MLLYKTVKIAGRVYGFRWACGDKDSYDWEWGYVHKCRILYIGRLDIILGQKLHE